MIVGPETRSSYGFPARTGYMSQLNQGKMVSDANLQLGLLYLLLIFCHI